MRILVALVLLAASVIAGLDALPVDVAVENFGAVLALMTLPFAVFYLLWRLTDHLLTPRPGEFETDRRLSRVIGTPWHWREQ